MNLEHIIRHLPVGLRHEYMAHGVKFRVSRSRRAVYCLTAPSVSTRARFGTPEEILEDIRHTLEVGKLPGRAGQA